jgi:hypothetical protein
VTEFIDIEPGLWLWRIPHPGWAPEDGGDRRVTSTFVETGGERVVLDPIRPLPEDDPLWERLEAAPPSMAIVLKPDHVRDIDHFVTRFRARGYGPDMFHKDDIPETDLEPIYPGSLLPGGLVALYDGRYRLETPIWIPDHGAIVFSDALTSLGGQLQVWTTPWHEERVLPALRAMLELPFEHVIVSHGDPVHDRAEFEAALAREPYSGAL